MVRLRCRPLFLFALLSALWGVPPAAAAPRDELLPLVPEDVSLCLVVNDLRGHGQKLANAPWLGGLRQTDFGKALLQSEEIKKLQNVDRDLKQFAGLGWDELRDDILGDCVVLGFYHAERKEDERGILMLWAKQPQRLAKLIQRVNEEEQGAGKVKGLQEKEYRGVKYTLRREEKQQQYYVQQGPLFLFTADEPLLRRVLDRKLDPAKGASPLVQSFARLGADPALVTLWVNPRPFDAQWKPRPQDGEETAAAKQAFAQYWKALDALAVSLRAGDNLELSVALQGRADALPPAARKFLQAAAAPSDLWQHFPAKSVLTGAARVDAAALAQMLEEFVPPAARPKLRAHLQTKFGFLLGLDFTGDVLPRLGPDLGFCVAANPGGPIPDMLFAVRIQPGPQDTPLDRAILKVLELVPVGFNYQKDPQDYVKVLTEQQDGVEVKYFSQRLLPPGLRPAFALKNGFLVLASSPQAVRRFGPGAAKDKDSPLMRLSLTELAGLLKAQRTWLLEKLADNQVLPAKAAGRWLDQTLDVFALLERLDLRQDLTPGQVAWTLRLQANAAKE